MNVNIYFFRYFYFILIRDLIACESRHEHESTFCYFHLPLLWVLHFHLLVGHFIHWEHYNHIVISMESEECQNSFFKRQVVVSFLYLHHPIDLHLLYSWKLLSAIKNKDTINKFNEFVVSTLWLLVIKEGNFNLEFES